jgi:hypothetical protein
VICVNAVDKGDRRRFGVKAATKGLRDESRKCEVETRVAGSEKRRSGVKAEGVRVKTGKELGGVAGAGRGSEMRFHGI